MDLDLNLGILFSSMLKVVTVPEFIKVYAAYKISRQHIQMLRFLFILWQWFCCCKFFVYCCSFVVISSLFIVVPINRNNNKQRTYNSKTYK